MGMKEIYLYRKRYFENYKEYAEEIKELAREFFSDNFLRLLVFGSVVTGKYAVGLSDIDIAVILREEVPLKEKIRFMLVVDEKFKYHPFEIHVVSESRWKRWYSRFVRDDFIEI